MVRRTRPRARLPLVLEPRCWLSHSAAARRTRERCPGLSRKFERSSKACWRNEHMTALAKPRHEGSAADHESAGQDRISPATLMPNGVAAEQHGSLKQKGLAVDRRRQGWLGYWVEAGEGV